MGMQHKGSPPKKKLRRDDTERISDSYSQIPKGQKPYAQRKS
ncbi:hypothetical protein BDA96_06G258600 [Sorghum bicolor]|uniref:Uncharacterized protein n=1 Tax=Sorghum bicolor TaxID=4558 RepID=A0A921QTL2_SORBI|nr:hypothetical protein BDA96_06G258600 [Sorghum bicolor]